MFSNISNNIMLTQWKLLEADLSGCEKGVHNWSWLLMRMVLVSGHLRPFTEACPAHNKH